MAVPGTVPMTPVEVEALKKLLEYSRGDEVNHFQECAAGCHSLAELDDLRKTHIYTQIQILDAFVERWDDGELTVGNS
jgi:hypothetical protein